jgi:hypothetical protein
MGAHFQAMVWPMLAQDHVARATHAVDVQQVGDALLVSEKHRLRHLVHLNSGRWQLRTQQITPTMRNKGDVKQKMW